MAGGAIPEVDVKSWQLYVKFLSSILYPSHCYTLVSYQTFQGCVFAVGGFTTAQMPPSARSPPEPRSIYHTHDLELGSYTALRLVRIAHWSFRYRIWHWC